MASEVGHKKCRGVEYKSNVYLIGGYINNKPTMIKVHDTPITNNHDDSRT